MKNDTSSFVDLDALFETTKVENTTPTVITESAVSTNSEQFNLDLDSILLEWSYRCESGSPVYGNKIDMIHLQNILDEKNIPLPFQRIVEAPEDETAPATVEIPKEFVKFYNALSEDKKEKFITFIDSMPTNLLMQFKNTMNSLSKSEISKFATFFKSLEKVESLNKVDYTPYAKLWETFVGQAIGKGELFISFAVENAVVQGSSESFDIDDSGRHYEVKSLDVFDVKSGKFKYGQIRPGAEGKVSKYLFTKQLMEFYSLAKQLQNQEIRSNVLTLGKKDAMEKIYKIIDNISVTKPNGGNVLETPGDIPGSMMNNVYNSAVELNKIKKLPLNKDVTTSRLAVKGSKVNASYWISPEDADEIATLSGKDQEATIKVGTPVSDESKEGKIVLTDLFNHPFVKDPKVFTNGLSEIKKAFFGDKAGLIYFYKNTTYVSANMSEFATTESSQDGYRFGLKDRNKGKAYIENQP